MKLHTALFLFLTSVTLSAARADTDKLAGRWHATLAAPGSETSFDLEVDEHDGVYTGSWTAPMKSRMSFPLVRQGHAIRFAIPNLGIFEGELHGDVLEGNIVNEDEKDPVHFDRAPESDFRDFVL